MPRILLCTQTAHPLGGVEAWLDGIVAQLVKRGWEPVVGLARGSTFHLPERYRAQHTAFETVEIDGRSGTRKGRVAALLRVLRRIRPELLVPVNLYDALEASARWKLSGNDCRLVVMLRGFQPASILDFERYRGFIDAAVTPNRLLLELLTQEAGLERSRCHYVPGGCRAPTTRRVRRRPGEPIRLGYVGRLEDDDKRVGDLATLVEALQTKGVEYSLVIVGQGSAEHALKARLAPELERGRVRFEGWRSKDELYEQVYPRLDAILLFSGSEAGPLVLWEAMAHGVVPIASRYLGSGAEGSLSEGETACLFPVGDVGATATAVQQLARDSSLQERLSREGAELVAARYRLTDHWAGWLRAFDGALQRPCARAELPVVALAPSGRLERIGCPPRLARLVRLAVGRKVLANEPGAEWPHCGSWPRADLIALERRAHDLDNALRPCPRGEV